MQDNMFHDWLYKRGITNKVITDFSVGPGEHFVLGDCIKIPVLDHNGIFSFNKYRRSPLSTIEPKYIYDKGGKVTLYGFFLAKDYDSILITEGEMDSLVAWSNNIPAVSSTGGALSFQKDWGDFFTNKEVTVCFDNDEAGGNGMAKVLDIIPHAYIVFLPDRPGIKDISDYVGNGGDLHELIKTRVRFTSLQDIINHRSHRLSLWQSTYFHDAYIKEHEIPPHVPTTTYTNKDNSDINRAKSYPIGQLIKFTHNKACCIWHSEDTASMHYFKKDNKVYCFGCSKHGDAIDVYRQLHNCSFNEAVKRLS